MPLTRFAGLARWQSLLPGHIAPHWKAGFVVPEWERPSGRVGWTDPEGLRPFLGHFCWHTTLQTADWYTPAAPAVVSTMRSLCDCGTSC